MVEVSSSNLDSPTKIPYKNSRLRIMPSGCFCLCFPVLALLFFFASIYANHIRVIVARYLFSISLDKKTNFSLYLKASKVSS